MSVRRLKHVDRNQLCAGAVRLFGVPLVIVVMIVDTRFTEGQGPVQPPRSRLKLQPASVQGSPAAAIQSKLVPSTIGQETATNTASQSGGGKMGVRIRNAEGRDGVFVTFIEPASPARHAGLKLGDRILSVDRRMVTDTSGLIREVSSHSPGEPITLQLVRDAQLYEFRVTLNGEPPASVVVLPIPPASTKIAVASAKSNSVHVREPGNDALALNDDEPINHAIFDSFAENIAKPEEAVTNPPSVQSAKPSSDRITKLKAEIHRLEEELRKLETGRREL